jgi:hypothetical protein
MIVLNVYVPTEDISDDTNDVNVELNSVDINSIRLKSQNRIAALENLVKY